MEVGPGTIATDRSDRLDGGGAEESLDYARIEITPQRPLGALDEAIVERARAQRERVEALNATLRAAAKLPPGDAKRATLAAARDAWWRATHFSPPSSATDAPERRFIAHVATDKPTYRPGDHLFVRAVLLDAHDLRPLEDPSLWWRDAPTPAHPEGSAAAALWPANASAAPPCWPRWGGGPFDRLPPGVDASHATLRLDASTWPPTYVVEWSADGASPRSVERPGVELAKFTMQQPGATLRDGGRDVELNACTWGGVGCATFELVVTAADGSVVHRSALTPPSAGASVSAALLGGGPSEYGGSAAQPRAVDGLGPPRRP